ncbi:MAG: hypothetical protein AB7L84_05320 [Acidimicrobiia bacterium]
MLAVLAVAGAAAGGAWLLARDGGPDADAALAEAQAFVEEAGSFHSVVTIRSRVTTGESGGAGTETTARSVVEAWYEGPDRWRAVAETADPFMSGTTTEQVVVVDGTAYVHSDFMVGGGPGPEWIAVPVDSGFSDRSLTSEDVEWLVEDLGVGEEDPYADATLAEVVVSAYVSELQSDPRGLVRIVEEARDPAVEERLAGGGLRLRVQLAPTPDLADALSEALDEPLPVVEVLLDLDGDRRPVTAGFRSEVGRAESDVDVVLDRWGEGFDIAPPAEDDIDRTPWVSEEALRVLDPRLLVAPADPADLVLTSALVSPADEEYGICEALELSYEDPEGLAALAEGDDLDELDFESFGYAWVSVSDRDCAREVDDSPFDDQLGGRPARGGDGWWEVDLGDVVVSLSTSTDDESLDVIAASLVEVPVDDLLARVAEPPSGWEQSLGFTIGG